MELTTPYSHDSPDPVYRQHKVWLRLRSPSQHGVAPHSLRASTGEETARRPPSGPPARQRAASLRPLARLARAAGQASWTVRITAAPPRAAGQPSLKELRCESSESEDERVGVDSSGGPCGRRSALLSRPPSRCPSAGFCAAARIEYCQRPQLVQATVATVGFMVEDTSLAPGRV